MRAYSPVTTATWRERRPGEQLPDQEERQLGRRAGDQRCGAIGLLRADCDQDAHRGQVYCSYHEKVRLGLLEPSAPIYPVWPLPKFGYVIISDQRARVA